MKNAPRSSRVPVPKNRPSPPARKTGKGTLPAKKKSNPDVPATLPPVRISPTFIQDSIESLGNLRNLCKLCLKYIQQADTMIDTLFSTANSLHESGVLQKLIQHRGRNLSTTDLATILSVLMNSPIGSRLFERMGGGSETPPPAS